MMVLSLKIKREINVVQYQAVAYAIEESRIKANYHVNNL
jgi:hypothetical protein